LSFLGILDWTEPWYWVVASLVAWAAVVVFWLVTPDLVLIPLIVAILITLMAIVYLFVPLGESGSAAKIDKVTKKQRCRVCHQYFDTLIDGTCQKCHQTIKE